MEKIVSFSDIEKGLEEAMRAPGRAEAALVASATAAESSSGILTPLTFCISL